MRSKYSLATATATPTATATATATETATVPPPPQVALPAFSPGAGMQATCDPVTVTITTTTAGANIRYTLDGTTPTETYGTLIAASSGTVSVVPMAADYIAGAAPAQTSRTLTRPRMEGYR
jgi:hypothetical protein